MKVLILFVLIVSSGLSFSQNEAYPFPDKEACFPGGTSEMMKFIRAELRYPQYSMVQGDKGRVYVSFVVERSGDLSHIEIHREGLTRELNEEAIRIIKSMPRWIPAEFEGVRIKSYCRMLITFELNRKMIRNARRKSRRGLKS